MNKIFLIGRLVKDPEVIETKTEIDCSRFKIAVERDSANKQVDFIPIVAWRQQAKFVNDYMRKGMLVAIEGRFSSYTFQNEEGKNITRYDINCESLKALETKEQVENREANNTKESNEEKLQDQPQKEVKQESQEQTDDKDLPWQLTL